MDYRIIRSWMDLDGRDANGHLDGCDAVFPLRGSRHVFPDLDYQSFGGRMGRDGPNCGRGRQIHPA